MQSQSECVGGYRQLRIYKRNGSICISICSELSGAHYRMYSVDEGFQQAYEKSNKRTKSSGSKGFTQQCSVVFSLLHPRSPTRCTNRWLKESEIYPGGKVIITKHMMNGRVVAPTVVYTENL